MGVKGLNTIMCCVLKKLSLISPLGMLQLASQNTFVAGAGLCVGDK